MKFVSLNKKLKAYFDVVRFPPNAQKMKFSIKDFSSKRDQLRGKTADLVTFIEEIYNEKPHFLCSVPF